MQIMLNGKSRAVATGISIAALLDDLRLDCRQVVVERNQQIVARQRHAEITLQEGDSLEIVHFVGGG